jgi:hypothetical protein
MRGFFLIVFRVFGYTRVNETKKGNPEMSTNAWIIAKNPAAPTEARQVYVHWDGGFWHLGPMLLAYYNTDERVQALINGGNMSTLAPVVGECEFYNRPGEEAQDTYITWGFNDDVCPPTTSYIVYNVLNCPKEALITPINEHWTSNDTEYGHLLWIKKHLK